MTFVWFWLIPFRSSLFCMSVDTYVTICIVTPDKLGLKNCWKQWQAFWAKWDRMRDMTGSPEIAKNKYKWGHNPSPNLILPYWESQQYLSQTWTRQMGQANKQAPLAKLTPNCTRIPFSLSSVRILTIFSNCPIELLELGLNHNFCLLELHIWWCIWSNLQYWLVLGAHMDSCRLANHKVYCHQIHHHTFHATNSNSYQQ